MYSNVALYSSSYANVALSLLSHKLGEGEGARLGEGEGARLG